MAKGTVGDIRVPRLNPFAFPSDTSLRFILLIVFVICGSFSLYGVLWWVFRSTQAAKFEEAVLGVWSGKFHGFNLANVQNTIEDLARRVQPAWHDLAIWKISGTVLTLGLATAIYWLLPVWKIWQKGLRPLSSQDLPDMQAYLECLCREAGLSSLPTFLVNPSEFLSANQISNAETFGCFGRYYIYLNSGLVLEFCTDRPAFRAQVLHELAHLRNADVNKTFFTMALGWSFVVIAIIPSAAGILWRSINWDKIYHVTWFGIGSVPLVWLTLTAVIRTREFYADVRASIWDGPSGSLGCVLRKLQPDQRSRWRKLVVKFHPDPCERQKTLKDTSRLLHLGFWDAFGVGLAAAMIVKSLQFILMGLFFTPELTQQPLYLGGLLVWVALGVPLFVLSLAVGVVGIGVWRGAFAALMRGQVSRDALRLGAALALGLFSGELLRLVPIVFIDSLPTTSASSISVGSILLLGSLGITLLFATLVLIFKWVATTASAWLEVVFYRRSPSPALASSLIIASGSMTVWTTGLLLLIAVSVVSYFFSVFSVFRSALNLFVTSNLSYLFSYLLFPLGSIIYATSFGLWVFPLAASLWRRKETSESRSPWAFLEEGAEPLTFPTQAPLRPALAMIIGLVFGLMFGLLLVSIRYTDFMGPWLDRLIPSVNSFYTLISISAFMQAIAATIVAIWSIRLGVIHGLCAASISGYLMILSWMLVITDYKIWWLFVVATLSTGTLLALPMATVVSTLARWRRGTRMQG